MTKIRSIRGKSRRSYNFDMFVKIAMFVFDAAAASAVDACLSVDKQLTLASVMRA